MVSCPAHPDKNPSLHLSEKGGKLLLFCHSGCKTEAIVSALDLQMADLFVEGNGNGNWRAHIEAVYPYHDESGKVLFEVVRQKPKQFYQRRPDGKGGWVWNLNGVRRVLYNLPQVVKSKSVLVVEGEKDCETAKRLGLVATTSGAVGSWRAEFAEVLQGRRVVIIADADEPGRKHARDVARSLIGVAESVRLLELPTGKDLSGWVAPAGTGTREGLLALIKSTRELTQSDIDGWHETSAIEPKQRLEPGGFRLTKLDDLMNEPEESASYVVEGRLPTGGLSVLASKPKAGKTTLSRNLALAVSRGEDFLGCRTTQGPVILLSLEEKRSEVRAHFRAMGATGEEPILIHCEHAPEAAFIALSQIINTHKPVLIIIDPLQKLMRVKDSNDYAQVTLALEPFMILARQSGAHLTVAHHLGKGERADATDSILGSTALFGGVDTAIILKRSERYRTIQSVQRYGVDLPETVLEFDPDTRTLTLGESKSKAEEERISAAMVEYLGKVKNLQTEPEILNAVEGRQAVKRAAIRVLFTAGKVTRQGTGKRGEPFTYGLPEEMPIARTQYIVGTRVRVSQKEGQAHENTEEMLVPEKTENPMLVPELETGPKPGEPAGDWENEL